MMPDRAGLPTVVDVDGQRRPRSLTTPDSAPTVQALVIVETLCEHLEQRFVRPKTQRQAIGMVRDLAAQLERAPVQLPHGRSFGISCPRCAADPGQPCVDLRHAARPLEQAHAERRKQAAKQRQRASRAAKAEQRWAKSWDRKGARLKHESS